MSPYARQRVQAAVQQRQRGVSCVSADIAVVTVKPPLDGGRPVGQARVTMVTGDEESPAPSTPGTPASLRPSPISSPDCPPPASPASPGDLSPQASRVADCAQTPLSQVTAAACSWPPRAAFDRLDAVLPPRWSAAGGLCLAGDPDEQDASKEPNMNRTEQAVYKLLMENEMSMDAGDRVLRLLRDQSLDFREVRFSKMQSYHTRVEASSLGIEHANLAHADDAQEVSFWYRCAWKTLRAVLQRTQTKDVITWGFRRRHQEGERVFSSFNDSVWLEGAYQGEGMAGKTVVGVMIGSDGARFKKTLSGHPIYLSCANFDAHHRQSPKGWNLLGFVPEFDQSQTRLSDSAFARRKRQIMDACLCLVTQDMLEAVQRGGEDVTCGDGQVRRIVPLLAIYPTDRQEHELVLHAKVHSCFHCKVERHQKSDPAWRGPPKCAAEVRSQTRVAMTRGVYGDDSEWKRLIKDEKPIMKVDPDSGTLVVVSVERYEDFARVMGHYPEPCNFMNRWNTAGVDVMHICRDDPMHMVQLGLMEHLMQACISRCISALSPEWACLLGKEVGPSKMIKVCDRMGARLEQSAPHLKKFAAQAFSRTFRIATRPEAKGGAVMSWGLTAFEMEALFRASVLCWGGLIDEELHALNSDGGRPSSTPSQEDPTANMVATLGLFLTLYNGMRQRAARQSSVRLCFSNCHLLT